jgi:hypothetical protein
MPSVPLWRQARCALCASHLLVRDDNEQVVCLACGARLEVLPTPTETRVRHVGEDLESVRHSLEPDAVDRALRKLRERQVAQTEALGYDLTTARIRRAMSVAGAALGIAGSVLIVSAHGAVGVLLFFLGMFLVLGGLGMRIGGFSQAESQQRQRERAALRARQALAREIDRRERFLAAAGSRSPSHVRS